MEYAMVWNIWDSYLWMLKQKTGIPESAKYTLVLSLTHWKALFEKCYDKEIGGVKVIVLLEL